MKFAEVTCSAKSRSTTHRVPDTGNKYRFRSGFSTSVEVLDDARYFAEESSYDVDWTARGRLASKLVGDNSTASEAVKSLDYTVKQNIAKALGIKANQADEVLAEELEGVAEEMKEEMEEY